MRAALALARLGPHPGLIGRTIVHRLRRARGLRLLRSRYAVLVAAPTTLELAFPPLAIGDSGALPRALSRAAAELRGDADLVLAHVVDLLGSGRVELGARIDWHRDFKSGYRWPEIFYQEVQVTRLDDASDAKVPWELSRCHHLLTLARAAQLFRDERYAAELESQLDGWLAANPPGVGINWTNAMEVALRAVNWVWAIATLECRRPLDADLRARVTASLAAHARHIRLNLEASPHLRSNHYLADVLGLWVVGTALRGAEADGWRAFARRELERELRSQVHPDGLGFEASLPYHGLALEMFLVARRCATIGGEPFSAAFDERLRRMLTASLALRHPNGRLPQVGDSDSGRVLPAGFARAPSIDNLLWLGAAELGDAEAPLPGDPHEEVAWTLGLDAWRRAAARPASARRLPAAFPGGGFYVLRSDAVHCVVRCGDVGQNGNGGHAHNDLLSFELSVAGVPLVVDSGTYVYTADAAARNAFRSTHAHNTVVVADAEINPIDPQALFRLRQFARPSVERWSEGRSLVASHDGYRRLRPSTRHRRTIRVDPGGGIEVEDELLGRGYQQGRSLIHLARAAQVELLAPAAAAIACDGVRAVVEFEGAAGIELASAEVSDGYGERVAAPLIVAELSGALPLRVRYRIRLAGGAAGHTLEAARRT